MRDIITAKTNEDQLTQAKNKEKNIALFNEMVRVGQDLERFAGQLQQLNSSSEARSQNFESRLIKAEQEAGNIDGIRTMLTNAMVTLTDKTESRLNQVDNSINIVSVKFLFKRRMTIK